MLKAMDNYDILDPETVQVILLHRESSLALSTKFLRFSDSKRDTRFSVDLGDTASKPSHQGAAPAPRDGRFTGRPVHALGGSGLGQRGPDLGFAV
jgi:hypothetical protein